MSAEIPKLTRRGFIKCAAALTAGAMLGEGLEKIVTGLDQFTIGDPDYSLSYLDSMKLPGAFIPYDFIGTAVNNFEGYNDSDSDTDIAIGRALQLGARIQNVFLNYTYEPEVGVYRPDVLEKVARFTRRVYELSGKKVKSTVAFDDAFWLLHADSFNIVYGDDKLRSPYLGRDFLSLQDKVYGNTLRELWYGLAAKKKKAQLDFFTDRETIGAYIRKVQSVVRYFQDAEEIAGWVIINEPEIRPDMITDPRQALTDWYAWVIEGVRQVDKNKPIVTGTADPSKLDERALTGNGVIASAHRYFDLYGSDKGEAPARRHLSSSLLPLVCTETGFCERVKLELLNHTTQVELPVDWIFPSFLDRLIRKYTYGGRLFAYMIGVWQVSPGHYDNFRFDPQKFPQSAKILKTFGEKVRTMSGLAI